MRKAPNPPGAQFEISIDGKPRSHRDRIEVAVEAADFSSVSLQIAVSS